MATLDIIAIIFLIIITLGGYSMGFGRSLKALTNGPIGFIISITVCVLFGGTLQQAEIIQRFIKYISIEATNFWDFLGYLHIGYVAFYFLLFLAVQIIRSIIVNTIAQVDYSQNKVALAINKVLGGALCLSFVIGVILLALAILNLFEDMAFSTNILNKISDSYLYVIYKNNPISFY